MSDDDDVVYICEWVRVVMSFVLVGDGVIIEVDLLVDVYGVSEFTILVMCSLLVSAWLVDEQVI